eukprot:1601238-Prorocentrum_lima.AAC.1
MTLFASGITGFHLPPNFVPGSCVRRSFWRLLSHAGIIDAGGGLGDADRPFPAGAGRPIGL